MLLSAYSQTHLSDTLNHELLNFEPGLINFINSNSLNETRLRSNLSHLSVPLDLWEIFSKLVDKNLVKYERVFSCDIGRFTKLFPFDTSGIDYVSNYFYSNGIYPVLAGGTLVNALLGKKFYETSDDIDLFFLSSESLKNANNLLENNPNAKMLIDLPHVLEHELDGRKYQLIKKEYAFPEEVIQDFDIRASGVCFFRGRIYWVKGSLKDIKNKKVNFMNIRKDSYTSYLRILKYNKKGFDISTTNMLLSCIQMLNFIFSKQVKNVPMFTDGQYFPDRTELFSDVYNSFLSANPIAQDTELFNPTNDDLLELIRDLRYNTIF